MTDPAKIAGSLIGLILLGAVAARCLACAPQVQPAPVDAAGWQQDPVPAGFDAGHGGHSEIDNDSAWLVIGAIQ